MRSPIPLPYGRTPPIKNNNPHSPLHRTSVRKKLTPHCFDLDLDKANGVPGRRLEYEDLASQGLHVDLEAPLWAGRRRNLRDRPADCVEQAQCAGLLTASPREGGLGDLPKAGCERVWELCPGGHEWSREGGDVNVTCEEPTWCGRNSA